MQYIKGINRRRFLQTAAAASCGTAACMAWGLPHTTKKSAAFQMVDETDHERILAAGTHYLSQEPLTITAFPAKRSAGGLHDFYSQADYFWPNPRDPNGPYINRDGLSNPENFNDHRKVMVALSIQMPALTAAWLLTKDPLLWQAGLRSSSRVVCHAGNADEPESDVCSGGSRRFNGAFYRHYRHTSFGRGGQGGELSYVSSAQQEGQHGGEGLVCELSRLAVQQRSRQNRT